MYVLGHAKDKILNELSLKYADDPVLLSGILSALPKRMESTLNMYKNRLLGTLPKTRDDFDAHPLLARVDGGEKTIVIDSNVDLPSNWQSMNLKELSGMEVLHASDGDGLSSAGTATSEEDILNLDDDEVWAAFFYLILI